jgi:hemoglobin
MHIRNFAIVFAVCGSALTMYACGPKKPPPTPAPTVDADAGADAGPAEPPPKKSLHDRLGGKDAIKGIVEGFVKKVQADKKVNGLLKGIKKIDAFKEDLANQICSKEVSGGECPDASKNLKDAHKGMKITDEQFDALLGHLMAALTDAKVGEEEQGDLKALIEPARETIVTVKKPAPKK